MIPQELIERRVAELIERDAVNTVRLVVRKVWSRTLLCFVQNPIEFDGMVKLAVIPQYADALAVKSRFSGRTTARDWADALADYQTHLNTCASKPQHQFPMSLRRCPWCDLELKGKPPAFAATTVRYTHWTQHYEGMMRLLLGRFAPIVLPSAYRAFFRVLPRRAWMGLGAAGLIVILRTCDTSHIPSWPSVSRTLNAAPCGSKSERPCPQRSQGRKHL